VNLQPPESTSTQGFANVEKQEASAEVVANVVEMRWDRVGTATKIKRVREEEGCLLVLISPFF